MREQNKSKKKRHEGEGIERKLGKAGKRQKRQKTQIGRKETYKETLPAFLLTQRILRGARGPRPQAEEGTKRFGKTALGAFSNKCKTR